LAGEWLQLQQAVLKPSLTSSYIKLLKIIIYAASKAKCDLKK
jgi:hypothetical protein